MNQLILKFFRNTFFVLLSLFIILLNGCKEKNSCTLGEVLGLNVDSAKIIISSKEASVSCKLNAYEYLAWMYRDSQIDSAIYYNVEGFKFAQIVKSKWGLSKFKNSLGYNYYKTGNNDEAVINIEDALKIAEEIDDYILICEARNNFGIVYMERGQDSLALINFNKMFEYAKNNNDTLYMALAKGKIGAANYKLNNILDAEINIREAKHLYERIGDSIHLQNTIYRLSSIERKRGEIQKNLGKDELSISHYNLAILLYKQSISLDTSKISHVSDCYMGIANIFDLMKEQDSCLHYANMAYNNVRDTKYSSQILKAANLLSNKYLVFRDTAKAFIYLKTSNIIKDTLHNIDDCNKISSLILTRRLKEIKTEKDEQYWKKCLFIFVILLVIALIVACLFFNKKSIMVARYIGFILIVVAFEFVNLIIDPFTESFTDNNPYILLPMITIIGVISGFLYEKIQNFIKSHFHHR